MGKIAIITGPLGQDGFYLSELLLKKDIKFLVFIIQKRKSLKNKFFK